MKFLCKECWLAHEPTTLLALCNECDARTQVRRLDPLKSKMAGSVGDGGELVCRRHPEEPLEIFCGAAAPRRCLGIARVAAACIQPTDARKSPTFSSVTRH